MRQQPKHSYGRSPRKRTKTRQFLLLALRPQGVTAWECAQLGICGPQPGRIHFTLSSMINDKGYDIRSFVARDLPKERRGPGKQMRPPVIYRLVGKWRWNMTYRSFITLDGL